jgi:hypothetical protein
MLPARGLLPHNATAHRRNRSEPISPEHLATLGRGRRWDGPSGAARRLRMEEGAPALERRRSGTPEWTAQSARLLGCTLGALCLLACGVGTLPTLGAPTDGGGGEAAAAPPAARRLLQPVTLHQTLPTAELTPQMRLWRDSWTALGFRARLADNAECRRDMQALVAATGEADFLAVYDGLETGVQRSDMWRYATLWLYGGVYADIDVVAEPPMAEARAAATRRAPRARRRAPRAPPRAARAQSRARPPRARARSSSTPSPTAAASSSSSRSPRRG